MEANKHYTVSVESNRKNYIHDFINGKEAVILEANCGEPAWFAYKLPDDTVTPWHRVHTSLVKSVDVSPLEFKIITENSTYVFKERK